MGDVRLRWQKFDASVSRVVGRHGSGQRKMVCVFDCALRISPQNAMEEKE